jgi:isopenicillin-N epimerase
MVDGAHVPGHISLNLREIEADFYTGACHKWMMTPKGSSFLFAKKEFQEALEPLVVSWGYEAEKPSDSRFLDYHQFNGTRDFSAYLCIPAAIQFMKEQDWLKVSSRYREMVRKWAPRFCEKVGSESVAPVSEEWIGQMFSIPAKASDPEKLQQHLFEKYRIEIPVTRRGQDLFIRFSLNAFNEEQDLEKLYDAVAEMLNQGLITKP